MILSKNQRRFILGIVGVIIIFFGLILDYLKIPSTAYLAAFIALCLTLLIELHFESNQPRLSDYVLENEQDFIRSYYDIKESAHSFCYYIWCGNYNESPNYNLKQYFESENQLILNKPNQNFKFYRIININPKKVPQEQYDRHLHLLEESRRQRKYFVETGDVDNLEVAIAECNDSKGAFYKAILILLDQNGKPAWGYKFNNRENPEDYQKIMTLISMFKDEWNKISQNKI